MSRKILVVDDIETNRKILRKVLSGEYEIIEAENGKEAYEILIRRYKTISAIILDIIMPVMDGYELLSLIQSNPALSQIPVIVATSMDEIGSEVKALSLGANDYVVKPYIPATILHRVRNTIKLRESAAIVNVMFKDELTGLYNRRGFFEKAGELIMRKPAGYYVIACFDIDNFKMINDQYGNEKGDDVLRSLADIFRRGFTNEGGLCCRMNADKFAVLYPVSFMESDSLAMIRASAQTPDAAVPPITFSIGRYIVDDLSLSIGAMYDRASLAEETVKGRFDKHVAVYDNEMRERLLREQRIVGEMNNALALNQFEVWFQPQYNHASGAMIGAEALVRWRHPEYGLLVPPGEFVPVFERNGFIYELDKFVWEYVCKCLRRWTDEGRDPLPVSVNISRYDLMRNDIFDVLTGLTEKYGLPVELLRLEITESAFSDETGRIICMTQRFVDYGFTVEIDDFGKGYSSLNTLKDAPASILKLDMAFLEEEGTRRGGNILESIVRMTKWLGMSAIAEGVETIEQADYLKSIGCVCIQGFLYAHPMPVDEFEELEKTVKKDGKIFVLETVENLDNNSFWNPSSLDTLIFNSYVGGACIFEYYNGNIELLRANNKYINVIGSAGMTLDDALRLSWTEHISPDERQTLLHALEQSVSTGDEISGEYCFIDLPSCPKETYLRTTLRVVGTTGDRYLVYCTNENTTAQHHAEKMEKETAARLATIMRNVNSGISAVTVKEGKVSFIFANERYYTILGYTEKEFNDEVSDSFEVIHPDDRARIGAIIDKLIATGGSDSYEYRCLTRSGVTIWVRCNASITEFYGVEGKVLLSVMTDITELTLAEQKNRVMSDQMNAIMQNVNGGISAVAYIDGKKEYIFVNERYYTIFGYTREQFINELPNGIKDIIYPEDLPLVYESEKRRILENCSTKTEYRVRKRDGSEMWTRSNSSVCHIIGVDVPVHISVTTDITNQIESEQVIRSLNDEMTNLINDMPGGLAVYEVTPNEMRLTFCNAGYYGYTGYSYEQFLEMSAKNPMFLVPDEDKPVIVDAVNTLRSGEKTTFDCVYRCRLNTGVFRWFNLKGSVSGKRRGALVVNVVQFDITEKKIAEDELRMSEERFRIALSLSGNIMCRYDIDDRAVQMSAEAAAVFGTPEWVSNVPYDPVRMGAVSSDSSDAYIGMFEAMLRGNKNGTASFQINTSSGWRWFSASYETVFSAEKKPVYAIVAFTDITENLNKEAIYNRWQQSLREKKKTSYSFYRFNLTKDESISYSDGELLTIVFSPDITFNQRTDEYIKQCVYHEDAQRFGTLLNSQKLLMNYRRGKHNDILEYRERLPDGNVRWIRLTVELVEHPTSSDIEAFLMFEDIDVGKREELYTKELAETDPLTGILNRSTFINRFNEILAKSSTGTKHALLMLDIDGFKLLNDVFGHAAGDQELINTANNLSEILRQGDLLARLGGDEFLIFLQNMPSDAVIRKKATQICQLLRKTFSMDVHISVSIGIAVYPRDGNDFDTLYRGVDTALYHVKDSGKNSFAFYSDNMSGKELTSTALQNEESSAVNLRSPAKQRVLIVDDNNVDREILANLFREEYTIEKARSGALALNLLRHYGSAIAAVMLDLYMPGIDGFEVLRRMKLSPELQSIPVVVISGDEDRNTELKIIRLGASDFISKPIDPELVRLRVRSAISKAENERLRAQNSFLLLQDKEIGKYRLALERTGTVIIECNWISGEFIYDPSITERIAGDFDKRKLWHILLSDMVADVMDVKKMQLFVHELAEDRSRMNATMEVMLKTPKNVKHRFRMNVFKRVNEYKLAETLIITFVDLDESNN